MSKLVLMVPKNRRACGRAALFAKDGRMLFGPVRVLATANLGAARKKHNARRDPRRPFGHPPSGSYLVIGSLPPGYVNSRRPLRFGRTGALLLGPSAGAALAAAANGRRLFYLHGGPTDENGRLRPTRGGLRVSDDDMTALLQAINRAFAAGDAVSSLDLIDVPLTKLGRVPSSELVGKGRPFLGGRSPVRARTPIGVTHAGLLLGGAGLLVERDGEPPPDDPSRRRLLAGALLLLGGVGVAGCCTKSDDPSPCPPVACDPADSWCPPQGYVCAGDVGGGADVGASGGATDNGDDGSGGGSG